MTEEERNEQMMQDGMAYMERMTAQFNRNFYQKQAQEEALKAKATPGQAEAAVGTVTEGTAANAI